MSEAYHTIFASLSVVNSALKSCAFNGMKIIVCVAKGARSKSVADSVAKHAEKLSQTRVSGSAQAVGASEGSEVGAEEGEVVGAFVGCDIRGLSVGDCVGGGVGLDVSGLCVGLSLGVTVGALVGEVVG